MKKFKRDYRLLVETLYTDKVFNTFHQAGSTAAVEEDLVPKSVEINPPFTVQFEITRSNLFSTNEAHFSVTNLGLKSRKLLHKDLNEVFDYRAVEFWAGYNEGTTPALIAAVQSVTQKNVAKQHKPIPRIFRGDVKRAYSYRQGTEFITKIEASDGGFGSVHGNFDKTYNEGTSYTQVISDLIQSIPNITIGGIGTFKDKLPRRTTISGNPKDLLQEYTNGKFYIDCERGYALGDNEYLVNEDLDTISDQKGLLGVPIKENQLVKVEMLFEPYVMVGQQIKLKTNTVPYYDGAYKVMSVTHSGLISESVSGNAMTILILQALDDNPAAVVLR